MTSVNDELQRMIDSLFAPLRSVLHDDDGISDVMGNPDGSWWYEEHGVMHPLPQIKMGAETLATGLEVIANYQNKHFNEEHPILNTQLPDGSRLSAALPPVVRPFPAVTIRKFRSLGYTLDDLVESGCVDRDAAEFIRQKIVEGKTLVISGGTGTGKTTFLNCLAECIPERERIVLIEDVAELRIKKPNLLAAECQDNTTAKSNVTFDILLKNSLRWRPDRIILGEVRGDEARTLLDSLNTGHGGSMTTIHGESPVGALERFTQLAMRAHKQATHDDIAAEVGSLVNFVVQMKQNRPTRNVSEIVEVRGYDRSLKTFMCNVIYERNQTGAEVASR